MALLELRDVRITYAGDRSVPAVRGVDLTLDRGQTLGVAGESGCGKSSLALALLRLLPRGATVDGDILLDGEDIGTMPWGRLRTVRWTGAAVIFQGAMHALNPVHRIGRQVAEPILIHEQTSETEVQRRVADLLAQVGLPAWRAQSYPHELSGGQRQRVMIAMALACSPHLIVADEATTALDVMIQAQVLALISNLVRQHDIALLMISHDLSVLSDTCERLAVMYAGQVIELGPAHAVFTDPTHPYADALSSAFPTVGNPASRGRPRGLGGDPPDPVQLPPGCPFHPRCPIALSSCAEQEARLRPVADRRHTSCLRVQADELGVSVRAAVRATQEGAYTDAGGSGQDRSRVEGNTT